MTSDIEFAARFTYKWQSVPIPPDQRLSWRLPVLLLSFLELRGGKASFKQLAIISYAINTPEGQSEVEAALKTIDPFESRVLVRYEPGLPYLLSFAIALGLLQISKATKYSLTSDGKALAEQLSKSGSFEKQIAFFKRSCRQLNDAVATRLLSPSIIVDNAL